MPAHRRVKDKDEELAHRDDSFRPRAHNTAPAQLAHAWRWQKRRIFAVIAGIILLYFLFSNILSGDESSSLVSPGHSIFNSGKSKLPTDAPRTDVVIDEERDRHYYEGRIRFYNLASSLHGISKTQGIRPSNRNVLFAASSLRSVANLMPLACAMGKWDRSFVHFAVLGRDPMSIEEILYINGVNDEECHLFMHDGRSDYSEYSTDKRAGAAVAGAMKHINDFMHPQAIIMDDGNMEDQFFTHAIRQKAQELRCTLIEIPKGKYQDFIWMTKLDSGSLASWHLPTIDILIHAPQQSSGGLLRTIKSLENADYSGLKPPRLTIELPPDLDTFAARCLQRLEWPPTKDTSPLRTNSLALRHRIPSSRVTTEEASLRFVEAFYPSNSEDNHVLILSSQAELSPLYFQFLYYTILEYRYSSYGASDLDDLLGVSLDVPNTLVNGKGDLDTPTANQMNSKRYTEDPSLDKSMAIPFLYGAPTSAASLIFGDKWTVLHSFLKWRLAANHARKLQNFERLVSEAEPVWMEYFLELIRTKGWYMLHPAKAFLTVHNELARIPEEYKQPSKDDSESEEDAEESHNSSEEPFLTAPEPPQIPERIENDSSEIHAPLHLMLPFDGDLPELPHLPYIDHTGTIKTNEEPKLTRMVYATQFRQRVGGCSAEEARRPRLVPFLTADDLFCLPDMDIEFNDEVETEDEKVAEAIVEATEVPSAPEPKETEASEYKGDDTSTEPSKEATEETKSQHDTPDG